MDIMKDVVFKNIFGNEKFKLMLSCMLSEIIKKDYKYIYENIIYLNNYLCKTRIYGNPAIVDILVKIDNIIINIEAYTKYDKSKKMKNINYISRVIIKNFNSKNGYNSSIEIVEINLIKGDKEDKTYQIRSKEKLYTNKIEIIDIYIDKVKEEKYTINKQNNLNIWKEILNGKLEEVIYKIEKLEYPKNIINEMKGLVIEFMSEEDVLEIGTTYEEWFESKIKEGKDEGKKEGIKETSTEIAKKLLKTKMPYEQIAEITGLSLKYIKNIKYE